MKIETLVCPNCGCREMDKVKISGNIGICPACDEAFVLELAEKLSAVEVDKTKDLHNFRAKLSAAIATDDVVGILNYSRKINEIIPEDYTSAYFHAYAQNALGNNSYLSLFYRDDISEHTPEEIERIIDHIINHSDLRDENTVLSYLAKIDGIDNKAVIDEFRSVFALRCQQEEAYDNIPRDVFICHRSTDNAIAEEICDAIEEDGNQCWISSRNLRPNDSENYWINIEKAIKSCTVFLVVSSRDAMLSKDVKREIEIATELGKPRLECKIDASKHTSLFKYFFDGITWIDLCDINEESLSDLKYRVFMALNPQMDSNSFDSDDFDIDGDTLDLDDFDIKDGTLLEYLGNEETVYIPDTVEAIAANAFRDNKTLQNVVLPCSVTTIGVSAFEGCENLETVVLPDGLDFICSYAFCGCSKLQEITVPDSVTYIAFGAFEGCDSISDITLPFVGEEMQPENLRLGVLGYIFGDGNHQYEMSRSDIIYTTSDGNGLTSQVAEDDAPDYYFYYAIPQSLRRVTITQQEIIPDSAFRNCDLIEEIILPENAQEVHLNAVEGCDSLEILSPTWVAIRLATRR